MVELQCEETFKFKTSWYRRVQLQGHDGHLKRTRRTLMGSEDTLVTMEDMESRGQEIEERREGRRRRRRKKLRKIITL